MLKIRVAIIVISLVVLMTLSACVTAPQDTSIPRDVADFFLNPPVSDTVVYGVGSAKMSDLNRSRDAAIARARTDIAFGIEASVKSFLVDYAQEAGADENRQVLEFYESISEQTAEQTLIGLRTERVEVGSDGTVYALVAYPRESLEQGLQNEIDAQEEFIRNEAAAFAEFKADEAYRRYIDENPIQSGQTVE